MIPLGVLAAVGALFGWGIADFLLQKLSRRHDTFRMMFCNSIIGLCITLPLAWSHLDTLPIITQDLWLIGGICLGIFINVFFSIEALRSGKLAVISPVFSLELPFTVLLTIFIAHELPTVLQAVLILVIFCGFFLLTFRGLPHDGKRYLVKLERGVLAALVGVVGLSFYNLTIGLASRLLHPAVTSFTISLFMLALSSIILLSRGQFRFPDVFEPLRHQPKLVLATSLLYTGAGLCFAYATTMLPISVATGISEGYVALSVLLGLTFNRERLKPVQIAGLMVVLGGIISLAFNS
ncbi:MAG TPA: DMT family transporter [Verrucomicrobiae bacterium]|nr:DMT family transporter [Verrucomicrobiae bacterium]